MFHHFIQHFLHILSTTPSLAPKGGWVGKGRAEKSEETSAAEIDLNFDVVQMGFMSSYVALALHGTGRMEGLVVFCYGSRNYLIL